MKIGQTSKPIKSSSCLQQRPKREQILYRTVSLWSCSNEEAALSCTIQADMSKKHFIILFPTYSEQDRIVSA